MKINVILKLKSHYSSPLMINLTKLVFIVVLFSACHSEAPEEGAGAEVETQTPVTVTAVSIEDLNEFTELNATSSYMDKNVVKASINGYIKTEATQKGKYVNAGQVLFTLITKEAR
ncbi:MAG: p-hydroxybenzoic acid efflux subunit AaeA, partial [Daejeonella sp.]|nr:p-hydroxybenzoic acid efflux subunit AaeA [Daejeonella sp.]